MCALNQDSFLTFTAGASECECWVNLILDLDEGIQSHWTTTISTGTCQYIN